MSANDLTIRIGGEAGMGLESSGAGFSKALTRGGLYVFGLPDYYSRIRGGHNFFSVRVAPHPLYSHAEPVHVLLALDLETIRRHIGAVVPGGAVIYDAKEDLPDDLHRADVNFCPIPLTALAEEKGGRAVMRNTLAFAVAAGLIGFDPTYLESVVRDNFARKGQAVVDANLRVVEAGVDTGCAFQADFPYHMEAIPDAPRRLILNGNEAFALGALAGGCRFVAAYPMTPGTPVLHWFAAHAEQYGVVTKHAEDEIGAINMAIGAAYVGARALVPTSGGGFSLMVEALGLAGITETPVVIYNAQRPGPATGMPTRTEQGDLLFVIHASQGEFPRFVLAPGTVEESFRAGWRAFNLADRYQTPVIVLSDHYLAVAYRTVEPDALSFDEVTIDRGALLTPEDLDGLEGDYRRFRVTDSGISPRATPGHPKAVWTTTANEHDELGAINEEPENRIAQVDKRMRKLDGMAREVEGPIRYGPEEAELTLLCWGSTYGPAREAVDRLNAERLGWANLLHFHDLWPFPVEATRAALERTKRTIVVEGNATGQLESLLRTHLGYTADGSIRRYDGRAFTPEQIEQRIKRIEQTE
ncbi:MAG TPA: 2-oxoacid:acceptor oxidoreductase subunit alpha [Thermoflexia bacterium]|nr:2-oxoacid:acceptor oxidoreductase subunit alpha [Thermoflexia bacterium]